MNNEFEYENETIEETVDAVAQEFYERSESVTNPLRDEAIKRLDDFWKEVLRQVIAFDGDKITFLHTFVKSFELFERLQELERTETVKRFDSFWKKGIYKVLCYDGNQLMALDCFIFAMGCGEMLTGLDCKENVEVGGKTIPKIQANHLSVKHFGDEKSRWTVGKCIKMFQECLGIETMPGQRSDEGRKQMKVIRKGQLKK